MISTRKERIAASFAAHAADYESHAGLQAHVADRLAEALPFLQAPRVLEVGCGTGLLTKHLLAAYPEGRLLITDLATAMVDVCRERHGASANGKARFAAMDGEAPGDGGPFDLIATSMTLQWFADPVAGLERLRRLLAPGGHLVFATLGPDNFREWREALARHGWREGMMAMPELPGVVAEERRALEPDDGLSFLRRLRLIGAGTPRAGYRPLPPGALRAALRDLDIAHGGRVTWHVVYGHLRSD